MPRPSFSLTSDFPLKKNLSGPHDLGQAFILGVYSNRSLKGKFTQKLYFFKNKKSVLKIEKEIHPWFKSLTPIFKHVKLKS